MRARAFALLAALLVCVVGAPCHAHRTALTAVLLEARDRAVQWRVQLAAEDLAPWLGLPGWYVPSRERAVSGLAQLASRVAAGVTVEARGGCEAPSAPVAETVSVPSVLGGYRVEVRQSLRCARAVDSLTLRYALLFEHDPTHRALVQALVQGARSQRVLDTGHREALFVASVSRWTTAREYTRLGFEHLLQGHDHLAFLLALVLVVARLPGRRAWHEAARVATAFTLSHSLTLGLAATGLVRLPSRPVEVAIAVSIALVCAENVLRDAPPARWRAALLFGLVHGLGFAGALAEVGLPHGAAALALGFFNAGVELGQLAVVALLLPFCASLAREPFSLRALSLGALALASLGLLLRGQGMGAAVALGLLPALGALAALGRWRWGYRRAVQGGASVALGALALWWAYQRAAGRG